MGANKTKNLARGVVEVFVDPRRFFVRGGGGVHRGCCGRWVGMHAHKSVAVNARMQCGRFVVCVRAANI